MEQLFQLGIKALILNSENKVLLLKAQTKNWKQDFQEHWDLPGGRVQKDHSIEETLRKETFEELGVTDIKIIKDLCTGLSNIEIPISPDTKVKLLLNIWQCSISDNAQIKISDEHSESGWFDLEKLPKLLEVKYSKELINKILNYEYNK